MPLQTLAMFFLGAAAVGGLAWVFLYPILSGERKTEQRLANVAKAEPVARVARNQRSRRDIIEETLKEFDERNKKKARPPLAVRIAQAGLGWSKRQYFLVCAGVGVAFVLFGLFVHVGLMTSVMLGFVGACGAPYWLLSFLKKRREARFLDTFPDAVDIIVRGIKAGLPLLDSLKMITTESPEPVRSEFRAIVETQAIGLPLGEACGKLFESMPVPEANFFGIVVTIQQRAGGNLAEALGNLSRVLRDRKKMKAKIRAMSQEAKSSAAIIVYVSSPTYIMLLFTEPLGHLMLVGSAIWMTMGVLVMKKMINFDF
jgi:tight adherence protein B